MKILIAGTREEILKAARQLPRHSLIGAVTAEAAFRRALREKADVVCVSNTLPLAKRLRRTLSKYRPSIKILTLNHCCSECHPSESNRVLFVFSEALLPS